MATVQLQCGHCKKLMQIDAVHLGSQLQCPHCNSIVQTQAPTPQPAATAGNWLEKSPAAGAEPQQESIFTEHDESDAVLGEAPAPTVEMPTAPYGDSATTNETNASSEESVTGSELPTFKPRAIYDKGTLSISLLIFLVPYAILTTGVILYLLFAGSGTRSDPFEYLRDPIKKDGPKRVQHSHDARLAAHLRTTIGKPIQAGDLQVTFNKVRLTDAGDLELVLRARNTSANTAFEPINDFFGKVDFSRKESKPYTFLESRSKDGVDNVYNMYLGLFKDPQGKQPQSSGKLHPKEEMTVVLTTDIPYRDKHIANIVKSNHEYTWRVHVRRGFVRVDGKDVSATMVIGLDFASSEIERPKT